MKLEKRKMKDIVIRKELVLLLSLLPAIGMMGIIFWFSSQNGEASSEMSQGVTESMFQIFNGTGIYWLNTVPEWLLHILVRKSGHMAEYAALAITVQFPFTLYKVEKKKSLLLTLVICILYAASDELHQSFIAGRSARITDVGIDAIGTIIGIACYQLFYWLFHIIYCAKKKNRERRKGKEKIENRISPQKGSH